MDDAERRKSTIERLRKLLQMTTANGCTEGEAMAAAEIAARLMADLGIDAGDVEFVAERARMRQGVNSARSGMWAEIARCTNTAFIVNGDEIEYVGKAPWPEVARYLHDLTGRAIDRELKAFQAGAWYRRRSSIRAKRAASHDFTTAMVQRLRNKLRDLFAATLSEAAKEAAGADLARRYPQTVTVQRNPARPRLGRYDRAAVEGYLAGSGVQISHGVGAARGEAKALEGGR